MRRLVVVLAVLLLVCGGVGAVLRVTRSLDVPQPIAWRTEGIDVHGDPLPDGAVARLGTVRFRTTSPTNLVWPDADHIAGGGFDREIVVWDAQTGERTQVLPGHRETLVTPVEAWSWRQWRHAVQHGSPPTHADDLSRLLLLPDGTTLVSTGETVRTWDLRAGTGRIVRRNSEFGATPSVSTDGRTLLCATECGITRLDLATGTKSTTTDRPAPPDSPWLPIAATHDATRFAVKIRTRVVRIVEAESGTWADHDIAANDDAGDICGATFSNDGHVLWMLLGRYGPERRTWVARTDVTSGVTMHAFDVAGDRAPFGIALSPDERTLAVTSIGVDKRAVISVHDVSGGGVRRSVDAGLPAWSFLLSFSPDSQRLAWVGDGTVHVLDMKTGDVDDGPDGHQGRIVAVRVMPGGRRVVTSGSHGVVRGWDLPTARPVWTLRSGTKGAALVGAPTAGTVVVQGADILTVDAASGDVIASRERDLPEQAHARVAADGTLLDGDGLAPVFSWAGRVTAHAPSGDTVTIFENPQDPAIAGVVYHTFTAFDPSVGLVLVQDEHRRRIDAESFSSQPAGVRLVDMHTGAVTWRAGVSGVAVFAVAGRHVVVGTTDGSVRVFDAEGRVVASARHVHNLQPRVGVGVLAISPDATLLASGGDDAAVRIWTLPDLRPIATLWGHGGPVTALSWAPDAGFIVSGSADTSALVWRRVW